MGFRITERDDRRRQEEARKIVSSHIDRHRDRSGGSVDYDEVALQQELIRKVNAIRQQRPQSGGHAYADPSASIARLKLAIAEVPIDSDSLFRDLEPEIILQLI